MASSRTAYERLKLLKITNVMQFSLALLQAMLVATGVIEIWQIAVISFFGALVNSFDQPTRSAILPDLVRREDLAKAIALNSSVWHGSALFGPTLAGVIIAGLSLKAAFFGNVVGFRSRRRSAAHDARRAGAQRQALDRVVRRRLLRRSALRPLVAVRHVAAAHLVRGQPLRAAPTSSCCRPSRTTS